MSRRFGEDSEIDFRRVLSRDSPGRGPYARQPRVGPGRPRREKHWDVGRACAAAGAPRHPNAQSPRVGGPARPAPPAYKSISLSILLLTILLIAQWSSAVATDQAPLLSGDAANGKVLVESSTCLDCHGIGERGSRLGPDLSEIGKLRSADELHRAIVAPDADILPQHRFVRVVLKDGTSVTGKLLNQDAFSIQLMNADQQLEAYLKSNLREHTIVAKGLMPSFEGKLTPPQLADIVSYLGSLKGAEK